MAAATAEAVEINLPKLPAKHNEFIQYVAANKQKSLLELVEPYKVYDYEMRKVFAQQPKHPAIATPSIVPIFSGHEKDVTIRARNIKAEGEKETETECFIMPLKDEDRKPNGAPAIAQSLKDFRTNFNVFSESALSDMDWSNVVVAGSAVVTSLLAVPEKHSGSNRALREYYHEKLAPASDVDLFLYGLTEGQAIEKIKQIEQNIRDAILVETTTIRTKNAITIASQYPTRHIQIVLRIYKSVSEILTGFDVDCSCAAYDGKQVYASPRALAAYMTQINTIDLTRRSPSYENRLSKYAHRGFEVYWPNLDRSRIDPTIFERSFGRTEGLARLLILEKLPKSGDRDAYLDQRRAERGRPAINRFRMNRRMIRGNIKNDYEDEVPEWVDAEDVSDYHTFTIPYGPKFHARKIEKLLYTKDLLLNSEWNKPKDREVHLHRHPAFFGRTVDVFGDCCGSCPVPQTVEEEEVAEEERKIYISGDISFIKDDPGRQTIGSFNPLTADDWTEMAYVGNTEALCKAIVDGDSEYVRSWLEQEGNDPNTRDYTGRTPLHLAVTNSTPEVVQLLIDHDARLVARLVDGKTALHLAAMRGNVEIISSILRRSEANEEEENKKIDAKRAARGTTKNDNLDVAMKEAKLSDKSQSDSGEESDVDMMDDDEEDEDMDATTENSMINIKTPAPEPDDKALAGDEDKDDPDVYDVNVLAWDVAVSPLHLAIVNGHIDAVKCLVSEFGADVLLPVKLYHDHDKSARAAILTLVLALQLQGDKAEDMVRTLVQLGASSAQADMDQNTTLQYCIAENPGMFYVLNEVDKTGIGRSINHLAVEGHYYRPKVSSALMTAIKAKDSATALSLLKHGAKAEIDFDSYMKAYQTKREPPPDSKRNKQDFEKTVEQPVVMAIRYEQPDLAHELVVSHNVDPNTLTTTGWSAVHDEYSRRYTTGYSVLDEVQKKLKQLREWKPEEAKFDAPIPLREDSTYFTGIQDGSYMWWSAKKQLEEAKQRYESMLKQYQKNVENAKDETGIPEKKAAIQDMIARFVSVENALLERGAKTFKELYPDIEPEEQRNYHGYNYTPEKPKPFKVEFNFLRPKLSDEGHARYLRLFEATWKAELAEIKNLTLKPWKNSDGDDKPPLTITVTDQHSLSPFSIAVLHGQFEIATAIMEIAQAQYAPPEDAQQQRYGIDGDQDSDMDEDSDAVQVYSEIVDEQFTVETIGEVSTQVKCRVKPFTVLNYTCPVADFQGGPLRSSPSSGSGFSYFGPRRSAATARTMTGKRTNTGSLKAATNMLSEEKRKDIGPPHNLIQFALHNDDTDLLVYLLDLGNDLVKASLQHADEDAYRYFMVSDKDYLEAIKLDRPHLLAEIIKRSGAGMPLNQLVKKSGVEIKEKPKYYQGLSVYGKKRKDWADAGRGHVHYDVVENHRPGLLEAARHQSLDTVEWFLSDAPMRCYQEFSSANKIDKRIRVLSEATGGFEAGVSRFLDARSHLAIHCCLMGKPVPESIQLLRFLIKKMPNAIDAKSQEGVTPLQIAFWHYREEAAKMLIEAGADQTCRDKSSNNLLHSLLRRPASSKKKLETLPRMLNLIDKRLLPSLFIERTSEHPGALTPFAQWVQRLSTDHAYRKNGDAVLRLLLQYSDREELNMINGEGHTPLHVSVRENDFSITEIILEAEPTLLLRENATGRTPFEGAEDAAIAKVCSNPPPLNDRFNHDPRRRARKFGLNSEWATELVNRSAQSFVETQEEDRRDWPEKVWDLLREVKAKLESQGKGKRRIVTLNEANEVARRLAASRSGRRHRSRYGYEEEAEESGSTEDTSEGADEVQLWMSQARSYLEDEKDEGTANGAGGLFGR